MPFLDWLRSKKPDAGFQPPQQPQETPQFIGQWTFFKNNYNYENGSWEEVERVMGWPEGKDVKDFVDTIQNRIRTKGKLPQFGWHKDKLAERMRKVVPEHGQRHPKGIERAQRKAAMSQARGLTMNKMRAGADPSQTQDYIPQQDTPHNQTQDYKPNPSQTQDYKPQNLAQTTDMPADMVAMIKRMEELEARLSHMDALEKRMQELEARLQSAGPTAGAA